MDNETNIRLGLSQHKGNSALMKTVNKLFFHRQTTIAEGF